MTIGNQEQKQRDQLEDVAIIQVRDDERWTGGSCEGVVRLLGSRHILRVEPQGFIDRLDFGYRRKKIV